MRIIAISTYLLISFSLFSQKRLLFEDKIYEPGVKTVQLFPERYGLQDHNTTAATALYEPNLVLEFDDLQADRGNYYAKLIHCNFDWTKSDLNNLDFLKEYNEFPINDYAFSGNTHIPYVHYRFAIPAVKIPGNYLLIVYRDGEPSDLLLSRRLVIYSQAVNMTIDNQLAGSGALRSTNQQLNFIIDYSRMEILNPMETVHVVIRQNHRWDNAQIDVKPSFIRESNNELEYRFSDPDKSFNAGNEFRFVDFRSLNFPGQNTATLSRTVKPFHLYVQQDKGRADEVYSQYPDFNGNYMVDNLDAGDSKISSNYVETTFSLRSNKPLNETVFLCGGFNGWERNEENEMKYFTNKSAYEATILLKQGLYNYQYLVDSPTADANYFEGNHFETENVYEILVYNRPFRPNADLLIGYFVIPVNQR
jgi:hypothetical protein